VTGGADQNPDQDGTAAPVNVHLYQLASLGKFERADVFPLTEKEEATLGTDLLASEEFFIAPGETHPVSEELRKGARFLGAAVLFRDIDRARWRASAPVAANGPTKLVLAISGVTATLTTSK
jgi:type VI secretion system protein VasD